MRIPRQKNFVSLDNIWHNDKQPKRSFPAKINLTAKNGLNNLGVLKYKITNPGKPLDLAAKKNIVSNSTNTINKVKTIGNNLRNRPAETVAKAGAGFAKDIVKAPIRNTLVEGTRWGLPVITGAPVPFAGDAAAAVVEKGVIDSNPVTKTIVNKADQLFGSEKLANKINPEKAGKFGAKIDSAAKRILKTIIKK